MRSTKCEVLGIKIDERGKFDLWGISAILVFVVVCFVGFQVGSAAWTHYHMRDEIRNMVNYKESFNGMNLNAQTIGQMITAKAETLGITLDEHNLSVGEVGYKRFHVSMTYTLPIELKLFTYNWHCVVDEETRDKQE